ncbi:MAG: cytochrome c biogenesis protein CcsA [bacterium]|nr:cytochrome c biogenesis protein CcsA [bacterium]
MLWFNRAVIALVLAWCVTPYFLDTNRSYYNLKEFGSIPVLHDGRVKPIDSVARNSLLIISGKQRISHNGLRYSPIEWFFEINTNPKLSDTFDQFLVENPVLFANQGGKFDKAKYRTNYKFLKSQDTILETQYKMASGIESKARTPFQREVVNISNRINTYVRLKNTIQPEDAKEFQHELEQYEKVIPIGLNALKSHSDTPNTKSIALAQMNQFFKRYRALDEIALYHPIPSLDNEKSITWKSTGAQLLAKLDSKTPTHPATSYFIDILAAYKQKDAALFNNLTANHLKFLKAEIPKITKNAQREANFNNANFFYKCILLYFIALLILLAGWATSSKSLQKLSYIIAITTFGIHTGALLIRMLIQGRPPVTNLYSSAIFVGWIAAGISLLIERINKLGFGTFAASSVGALTLIVAHHFALQGDTIEMMQAVLDSNFWLATHVVTITMGYGAMFMAGSLAHIYIIGGFLFKKFSKEHAKALTSITYATLCISILLSFIGTVLGGIWADQSWGRFWGWDPKENGAILIVLWLAIVLHLRLAGRIKQRGLMVMCIFGNMVCSFSWFGVNLLGIGLHSYGFMEKGFLWLSTFWIIQITIACIGLLPKSLWKGEVN